MVRKEVLDKLKNAKVQKDRKWVYNLVVWALENQSKKDAAQIQQRIASTVHYAKGKYQDYWDNPRVRKQHKKAQDRLRKGNQKYQKISKKYNTELKLAYRLYKEGMLSKSSTKEIDEVIKKLKKLA